jgi:hypothetical protein
MPFAHQPKRVYLHCPSPFGPRRVQIKRHTGTRAWRGVAALLFQPPPDALQRFIYVWRRLIERVQVSDQPRIAWRGLWLGVRRQPLLALGKLRFNLLSRKWRLMLCHRASFLLFLIK